MAVAPVVAVEELDPARLAGGHIRWHLDVRLRHRLAAGDHEALLRGRRGAPTSSRSIVARGGGIAVSDSTNVASAPRVAFGIHEYVRSAVLDEPKSFEPTSQACGQRAGIQHLLPSQRRRIRARSITGGAAPMLRTIGVRIRTPDRIFSG